VRISFADPDQEGHPRRVWVTRWWSQPRRNRSANRSTLAAPTTAPDNCADAGTRANSATSSLVELLPFTPPSEHSAGFVSVSHVDEFNHVGLETAGAAIPAYESCQTQLQFRGALNFSGALTPRHAGHQPWHRRNRAAQRRVAWKRSPCWLASLTDSTQLNEQIESRGIKTGRSLATYLAVAVWVELLAQFCCEYSASLFETDRLGHVVKSGRDGRVEGAVIEPAL